MANNYAYIGEELKYLVNLTSEGFSMLDDDFQIVLQCGKTKVTKKKEDLLFSEDGYILTIDTSVFKAGDLYAIVSAYVPDEDFDDGKRTEVDKVKLITLKDTK